MSLRFKLCDKTHISEILRMGALFYDESNFEKGGYDPEQFEHILSVMMEGDSHHIIMALSFETPVGFIIFDISRHYTKYNMACMYLLYVDKDQRVYGAGAELIRKATQYCKTMGCKYFYSSSSAGFDDGGRNEKVLRNIYKKQGFEDNGFFMRKELS